MYIYDLNERLDFPILIQSPSHPLHSVHPSYKLSFQTMHFFSTLVVASAFVATSVLAHPGHDTRHEIEERAAFMKNSKRDLSHCAAKMKARGLEARAVQRRAAVAKSTREKRGLSTSE